MGRLRLRSFLPLFASLLAAPSLVDCSSSDSNGHATPGTGEFRGLLTGPGETGVLDVTIGNAASPASLRGLGTGASGTTVSGTIQMIGTGVTITLSGSFDAASGKLTLTGTTGSGAYSLTGTASGSGFSGTYSGPNGSGVFSLAQGASGAVSLYCGTFDGDDRGVWNVVVDGSGKALGSHCDAKSCGALEGSFSGGNVSLGDPSDPKGGGATGKVSGTTASGTWQGGSSKGTWQGSEAACHVSTHVDAGAGGASNGGAGGASNGAGGAAQGGAAGSQSTGGGSAVDAGAGGAPGAGGSQGAGGAGANDGGPGAGGSQGAGGNSSFGGGSSAGGASSDGGSDASAASTVFASDVAANALVVDNGYLYWMGSAGMSSPTPGLGRIPLSGAPDGGFGQQLLKAPNQSISNIIVSGGNLYYDVGSIPGSVNVMATTGGAVTKIAGVAGGAESLFVSGAEIFWSGFDDLSFATGTIRRAPVGGSSDGGGSQPVVTGLTPYSLTGGLYVDATDVYWADGGDQTLKKAPRAGLTSTPETLAQGVFIFVGADANRFYWEGNDYSFRSLSRTAAAADGGATTGTLIYRDPRGVYRATVDGGFVYWASSDGNIRRVPVDNPDGGAPELLATTHSTSIYAIVVDATYVYWAEDDSWTIHRVPK
jgi:hypothetical protein